MAGITIGKCVGAQQREAALLMNFRDVRYNPRKWRVATITFISECLLVHIFMATKTLGLGLIKNQRGMAHFTTYRLMLTNKGKTS